MYNKTDFDRDISQIWLIYTNSYEYFNCLSQLKNYKKNEYTDSRFMSFVIYTSWYILIIELCKVYQNDNKNQHFNVYGLLNKLINNYKNLDFKTSISLETIKNYHLRFNSPEVIDIRDRLIILRDKFYAHFDREKLEQEVNIQLLEIEVILNLLKDFINEIKLLVFRSQIDFDNDIFVHILNVMDCIDGSNMRYHDKIIRKFKKESKRI